MNYLDMITGEEEEEVPKRKEMRSSSKSSNASLEEENPYAAMPKALTPPIARSATGSRVAIDASVLPESKPKPSGINVEYGSIPLPVRSPKQAIEKPPQKSFDRAVRATISQNQRDTPRREVMGANRRPTNLNK
eukprot:TRINITY_DN7942_c0_g1_i1.p1 TRINITY_DN7942_c0_g1~~TRINITY_DN7942_c0_g1_i1.p1  ORF type:complete len:134 (-),score=26.32 TRINITY_DN7942_c0_g1_i1:49-450(-)